MFSNLTVSDNMSNSITRDISIYASEHPGNVLFTPARRRVAPSPSCLHVLVSEARRSAGLVDPAGWEDRPERFARVYRASGGAVPCLSPCLVGQRSVPHLRHAFQIYGIVLAGCVPKSDRGQVNQPARHSYHDIHAILLGRLGRPCPHTNLQSR